MAANWESLSLLIDPVALTLAETCTCNGIPLIKGLRRRLALGTRLPSRVGVAPRPKASETPRWPVRLSFRPFVLLSGSDRAIRISSPRRLRRGHVLIPGWNEYRHFPTDHRFHRRDHCWALRVIPQAGNWGSSRPRYFFWGLAANAKNTLIRGHSGVYHSSIPASLCTRTCCGSARRSWRSSARESF